ncbi:MAG: UDP-glucose/GDP-mannose dehydrogenase family protein [Gemmatimonadetes bacterium]|nr:UDP-glucose/GDP-mannose dehydrogenase family protein [Gemmatimonadota bacterium]
MKVAVVGTGYVGLVVGACFAETGNDVTCVDVDPAKIAGLRKNVIPIYEPGLGELVERNQRVGRLHFTTVLAEAVTGAEAVFIAVGTPPDEDGSADLRHVLGVARDLGPHLAPDAVVVTKSTVPVGTGARVREAVASTATVPFHVCSNPEFLKEGAAVEDSMRPDRVVVGADSARARDVMSELYAPFVRTGKPILFMDVPSAELTKYAANAMLATRITFMNEIANLCERVGANVDQVRRGIGSDARIGSSFLFPGPGYGGSCFPKDVQALERLAAAVDSPLRVVAAVHAANEHQKGRLFAIVRDALGGQLAGRRVAIWGLAFKAQTDDMRESPALVLIEALLGAGATVVAHDPAAMDEARRRLGTSVTFAPTAYDALEGADALVIVTDWNEYRHPNFDRMRAALARPVIVDGRNLYDPERMARTGFTYRSIGRPAA